MHKKVFAVVGMGYGDEGKGQCVHALCKKYNVGLVVRFSGGPQCGHGVTVSSGTFHEFHMFGSGTFQNIPTLLGPEVVVNLLVLQAEAETLETKGIQDPLSLMSVSRNCVLTTPYHIALNKLKEMSRTSKYGSCGYGLGATVKLNLESEDVTLRVQDLLAPNSDLIVSKLEAIRYRCFTEAQSLNLDEFLINGTKDDHATMLSESRVLLYNGDTTAFLVNQYKEILSKINVLNFFEIADLINKQDTAVFEGNQGILLDKDFGFYPHITLTSCTSENARKLLNEIGWHGSTEVIGVTRAYMTRHGAGPFVTKDSELDFVDHHNRPNQFQGNFRNGWLDLVALKYACEADGHIDSLAITHLDYLNLKGVWKVCVEYPDFGPLQPLQRTLEEKRALTTSLFNSEPLYAEIEPSTVPKFINNTLDLPFKVFSEGPTEDDQTVLPSRDDIELLRTFII